MKKWEYKEWSYWYNKEDKEENDKEILLNSIGDEGWELVQVNTHTCGKTYFFKREIVKAS